MNYLTSLFFIFAFTLSTAWGSAQEVTWSQLQELAPEAKTEKDIPASIKGLLDKTIHVKGFMMPLDYSQKKISEFLLMPYVPACAHVPPPPANQLILVKMEAGNEIEASFYPVEVEGVLQVKPSQEFESSYEMVGKSMKELK